MWFSRGLSVFSLVCAVAAPLAAQDRGTILVLDGSGSMWAQLPEGRSRIEVARDVLTDFLVARDPSHPLGVIAYGHNRRGDCGDIETIAPLAIHDGRALAQRLRGLMPRGKTPIADTLRRAAAAIPPTAETADIVLITDGLETCGGDPCAVAAELAAAGVPIRAHVVGFGLSEGEVRQIACIAEQTGGTVLATQSGAELAEVLASTAAPVSREAAEPSRAALDLALDTDPAGRPDTVDFSAENLDTGAALALGRLDFSTAWTLPVDLPAGRWRILAQAADSGQGATEITVTAGESRTVYVPFTGLLPSITLDQIGPYRAGATAVFPLRIAREGLATGGADFQLTLLPADATALDDRPLNWTSGDGSLGAYLPYIPLPSDPARYRIAWHRYGETDLSRALALIDIVADPRPVVTLAAPSVVAPGAAVPVAVQGGGAHADRVEIWRDGALYGWDQSLYLADLFDTEYGPAKVLPAPSEPGAYEIVYLFSDIDGDAAIAARLPLNVGEVTAAAQEGGAPDPAPATPAPEAPAAAPAVNAPPVNAPSGDSQGNAAPPSAGSGPSGDDLGYACPADAGVPCLFEDTATALLFGLPPGWSADTPTRAAAVAGNTGSDGPVRVTFQGPADAGARPATITLNPHQWIDANGPCQQVQAGRLCHFDSQTPELARGLEVLTRALRDMRPAARAPSLSPQDALQQAMRDLAASDPAAAAAMGGLLDAAQAADGTMPDAGAIMGTGLSTGLGIANAEGHGPDLTESGTEAGRAWGDYPHRCLGDDRPNPECSLRDAASGLAFDLPEGWVAEVLDSGPHPRADFFDAGPDAGYIALNPTTWPNEGLGCAATRAGRLCLDPGTMTADLGYAYATLRQSLTTGEVLATCAETACTFTQDAPALTGALPALWSVERARAHPEGGLSTWFFDVDGGGNLKLLGLGQRDGGDCVDTRHGPLCDLTGYISSQEFDLIAGALQ